MKTYDGTEQSASFFTEEADHLHNALSYASNMQKTLWQSTPDGKPDLLISGHVGRFLMIVSIVRQ